MNLDKGCFIIIEGPDGSGKTTIAKRLLNEIQIMGYESYYRREPGTSIIGEQIRRIVLNMPLTDKERTLLFMTSFASSAETIKEYVNNGAIVICDRFLRSTAVYQNFCDCDKSKQDYIRDTRDFVNLGKYVMSGIEPDLEIVLDVCPAVGFNRIHVRNDKIDVIEEEGFEGDIYDKRCHYYSTATDDDFVSEAMGTKEVYHVDTTNLSVDGVFMACFEKIVKVTGI